MHDWVHSKLQATYINRLIAWSALGALLAFFPIVSLFTQQNGSSNNDMYFYIGMIVVFLILFIIFGLSSIKYIFNISTHPLIKRINESENPTSLEIEAEQQAQSPKYSVDQWLVTDKYLIQDKIFTFDLLQISGLLWAYKQVVQESVNYIPTGKIYKLKLVCYDGFATIEAKENIVDDILAFANQCAPWAIFEFSEKLEKLIHDNPEELCVTVEENKRKWGKGRV